jgi:hypothetical protein
MAEQGPGASRIVRVPEPEHPRPSHDEIELGRAYARRRIHETVLAAVTARGHERDSSSAPHREEAVHLLEVAYSRRPTQRLLPTVTAQCGVLTLQRRVPAVTVVGRGHGQATLSDRAVAVPAAER